MQIEEQIVLTNAAVVVASLALASVTGWEFIKSIVRSHKHEETIVSSVQDNAAAERQVMREFAHELLAEEHAYQLSSQMLENDAAAVDKPQPPAVD